MSDKTKKELLQEEATKYNLPFEDKTTIAELEDLLKPIHGAINGAVNEALSNAKTEHTAEIEKLKAEHEDALTVLNANHEEALQAYNQPEEAPDKSHFAVYKDGKKSRKIGVKKFIYRGTEYDSADAVENHPEVLKALSDADSFIFQK